MNIVIIGAGKVGSKIVDSLVEESHNVTVVDTNPARLNELANRQDIMCVQGSGALYEVQNEANVKNADVVIAVSPLDEVNMLACLVANSLGAKRCIARVRNPEYSKQLEYIKDDLGLSMTVNPELLAASEIMRILVLPAAANVESFANGRVELVEFKVNETSPIVGKSLAEISGMTKSNILVCTAERDGKIIIPNGNFIPLAGDKISVAATHDEVELFFKKTGSSKIKIKSIMIVGGGRVGYYLTKQLTEIGMAVKIIEQDYQRCVELSELLSNVSIIHADGSDHNILKEEGIESVDAFVALTGLDEVNMITSIYAQTKNVSKVIAKVTRGSYISMSDNIGVESIVSPKSLASNSIISYVRAMKNSEQSNNVETIYKLFGDRVEALEFIVKENASYIDVPLSRLSIKKDVLIASIVRNNKNIVPNGSDCIKIGDSVIVITTSSNLHELSEIFI